MSSTVLMISPGYPAEMPFFTRGLARAGAQVIGAGDQPRHRALADARATATVLSGLLALLAARGVRRYGKLAAAQARLAAAPDNWTRHGAPGNGSRHGGPDRAGSGAEQRYATPEGCGHGPAGGVR